MDIEDGAIEQPSGYDEFISIANEESGGSDALLNPNDLANEEPVDVDESASGETVEEDGGEPQEGEAPAGDEKQSASEEKGEGKDKEKSPSKVAKEPSIYEVTTADGKTVSIKDDIKLTAKINGEEKEFTLAEAVRHYQFDVPYNQKMDEVNEQRNKLTKEQKALELQKAAIENQQQTLGGHLVAEMKALSQNNVPDFVSLFAEARNSAPSAVYSVLRNHFIPEAVKYLEADEAGRKLLDSEARNKYNEEENQILKRKHERNSNWSRNQNIATELIQSAGLSPQEWSEAEAQVVEDLISQKVVAGPPTAKDVANWSADDAKQYTEAVIARAQASRNHNRIAGLISQKAPDLRDDNPDKFKELLEFAKRFPDWDDKRLIELIESQLGLKSSDNDDDVVPISESKQKPAKSSESKRSARGYDLSNEEEEEDDNPLAVFRGIGSF